MRDKVVVVTGGASGIGRSAALAFAREGARVLVSDISVEGGEQTVRLIVEQGGEAIFMRCDVSKSAEVETMINEAVKAWSRLDYAFNNAGVEGIPVPTADASEEDWDSTINVNLKGVWLCMKHEIPQMLKQGGGAIVNNSSVAGLVGAQGLGAYTASKHGVVGLTKSTALEYAKQGIRVNAVCPGPIRTPMCERLLDTFIGGEEVIANVHPMGRMGSPEEVAEAVVWLCSDAASYVTGHAMALDGGAVAF